MKFNNLLFKIFLTTIIMLILSFILPIPNNKNIQDILGPATFLFGIIFGFEIYIVLENFFQLKILLGSEIASLLSIYYYGKVFGNEMEKEITRGVENYILTAIDYSLEKHVSATDKDFFTIFEPVKKFQIKDGRLEAAVENIDMRFHDLVKARMQIGQLAQREVAFAEWFMLIALAFVMIIVLFFIRQPELFSLIATAIFASTIIGTLFLLEEVDSNRFQEDKLEYEYFNQALTAMEKTNYYPEFAIKSNVIHKPKNSTYRIGIFPKYPSLTDREIKIIT